ncbi:hypothetical protein M0812_21107 [Anaeramoeba flamelloides]|uniref:Uncharacterized protein n=1 Tax=Anaeramoeba flamelloides TaxID=1746091 RepID=A0AAV7YU31_9EUKA|nr:hypothetical protein M0812_21107 [Anaeramoeba flamelloides]
MTTSVSFTSDLESLNRTLLSVCSKIQNSNECFAELFYLYEQIDFLSLDVLSEDQLNNLLECLKASIFYFSEISTVDPNLLELLFQLICKTIDHCIFRLELEEEVPLQILDCIFTEKEGVGFSVFTINNQTNNQNENILKESNFFISAIKYFQTKEGTKKLFLQIFNENHQIGKKTRLILEIIDKNVNFLPQEVKIHFLEIIKELYQTILNLSINKIKNIPKNELFDLIYQLNQISMKVSPEKSTNIISNFELNYSLKLFSSTILPLRIMGITLLTNIAEKKHQFQLFNDYDQIIEENDSLKLNEFNQIKTIIVAFKEKVVCQLFSSNAHNQILKNSTKILQFLAFNHEINKTIIDLIWNEFVNSKTTRKIIIYDLLFSIISHLPKKINQYIYNTKLLLISKWDKIYLTFFIDFLKYNLEIFREIKALCFKLILNNILDKELNTYFLKQFINLFTLEQFTDELKISLIHSCVEKIGSSKDIKFILPIIEQLLFSFPNEDNNNLKNEIENKHMEYEEKEKNEGKEKNEEKGKNEEKEKNEEILPAVINSQENNNINIQNITNNYYEIGNESRNGNLNENEREGGIDNGNENENEIKRENIKKKDKLTFQKVVFEFEKHFNFINQLLEEIIQYKTLINEIIYKNKLDITNKNINWKNYCFSEEIEYFEGIRIRLNFLKILFNSTTNLNSKGTDKYLFNQLHFKKLWNIFTKQIILEEENDLFFDWIFVINYPLIITKYLFKKITKYLFSQKRNRTKSSINLFQYLIYLTNFQSNFLIGAMDDFTLVIKDADAIVGLNNLLKVIKLITAKELFLQLSNFLFQFLNNFSNQNYQKNYLKLKKTILVFVINEIKKNEKLEINIRLIKFLLLFINNSNANNGNKLINNSHQQLKFNNLIKLKIEIDLSKKKKMKKKIIIKIWENNSILDLKRELIKLFKNDNFKIKIKNKFLNGNKFIGNLEILDNDKLLIIFDDGVNFDINNIKINNLKIIIPNNHNYNLGEENNDYDETQNKNNDENEIEEKHINYNYFITKYFKLFFSMFDYENEELSINVLQLFSEIKINIQEIRKITQLFNSKETISWSEILPKEFIYQLYYKLEIINGIITMDKKWSLKFINFKGLNYLIFLLINFLKRKKFSN